MVPASICVFACAGVNIESTINRKKRTCILQLLSGLYQVPFVAENHTGSPGFCH
jgi:hypothetical protein